MKPESQNPLYTVQPATLAPWFNKLSPTASQRGCQDGQRQKVITAPKYVNSVLLGLQIIINNDSNSEIQGK